MADPGIREALRAKTQQAQHHAQDVRADAQAQRERTRVRREAETEAVDAARAALHVTAEELECRRCGAVWSADAIRAAVRRRPGCLFCGGPLVEATSD